jgi:DNA-binding NarL/FixJ family response regulator
MDVPLLSSYAALVGLDVRRLDLETTSCDEERGLQVFDRSGRRLETIDELHVACGRLRPWRRSAVTPSPLTSRQAEIADLVRSGRTTTEIAGVLRVSPRTVTTERSRMRSAAEAALATPSSVVRVGGRPGLARDLIDAAVHREPERGDGPGPVRIVVQPSGRDLYVVDDSRVVVVGALPPTCSIVDAIRCGVVALLPIDVDVRAIIAAMIAAGTGAASFRPTTVQAIADELWSTSRPRRVLTPREAEVIRGVREYESIKQSARRLGISPKTVENLRANAYAKLGVRSAFEARSVAAELGVDLAMGFEQVSRP